MARCDYCDSYILFGGKKKSGRTFCNDECLQEGRLMIAADRLPQHAVDDAIGKTHQGECPLCQGPGPIDVHTSHTVWSIIALTSWKSTPHVCCRSCGRQKQLTGFVTSGLFGWWGFPWGFIYTPIQLYRNLSGMIAGPDPEAPSEQLETLTRLELAIRVEAGEPLPTGRKPSRKTQNVEPADDRISVECDDCGKRFKAKAAMAGKSGKCPGCGSSITVPEQDPWLDDEDADDEWGEDAYDNEGGYDDDNAYGDDWTESPSPQRSPNSRRKSKPKKKKWSPLRIGVLVGLGIFALPVFGVLIGLIIGFLNDDDPQPQFGQNDRVVPNPVQPNFEPQRFPIPASGNRSVPDPAQPGTAPNAANPSATSNQTASNQPTAEIKPVPVLNNSDPGGSLWIVLSNFRKAPKQGFGGINRRFLIDYQVAAGTPSPNEKYVLHVSKSLGGGSFTQYSDIPVQLKTSGTVDFGISPALGVGNDIVATIANPTGGRKWKHRSGELVPDGPPTDAKRPPTIRELVGADAQGKIVAIANAVFEKGTGPFPTLSLDFVMQQQIDLAGFYMLVAETPDGERIEFDIKIRLQQTEVGTESKYAARLVGRISKLQPPFTLHIEKRKMRFISPVRRETPEIVSNKISVAD